MACQFTNGRANIRIDIDIEPVFLHVFPLFLEVREQHYLPLYSTILVLPRVPSQATCCTYGAAMVRCEAPLYLALPYKVGVAPCGMLSRSGSAVTLGRDARLTTIGQCLLSGCRSCIQPIERHLMLYILIERGQSLLHHWKSIGVHEVPQ